MLPFGADVFCIILCIRRLQWILQPYKIFNKESNEFFIKVFNIGKSLFQKLFWEVFVAFPFNSCAVR
jgi:hypothetical protein